MSEPAFVDRGDGVRLAYRLRLGRRPTIVFLPGYASDMDGSKAVALDAWAAETGHAVLRLDYAGCGTSDGAFEDGTLASWRDDALRLIDTLVSGPVLLVGSSMGGWLMLLLALQRPDRVTGLVGIAAAPDFTRWGFGASEKAELQERGRLEQPSAYGAALVTTRAFWESGEANLMLDGEIEIDCPVRLLHGQADPDVPWDIALRLAGRLRSGDVQTILIKDGDHRLSRDSDIALLISTVSRLLEP